MCDAAVSPSANLRVGKRWPERAQPAVWLDVDGALRGSPLSGLGCSHYPRSAMHGGRKNELWPRRTLGQPVSEAAYLSALHRGETNRGAEATRCAEPEKKQGCLQKEHHFSLSK